MGVLIMPGHLATWPTMTTIIPAWFDHLEESFSEKGELKNLGPPVWWPSIIIVKYVSFWGEKNKYWKDTKNISNQNRKKGEKTILQ